MCMPSSLRTLRYLTLTNETGPNGTKSTAGSSRSYHGSSSRNDISTFTQGRPSREYSTTSKRRGQQSIPSDYSSTSARNEGEYSSYGGQTIRQYSDYRGQNPGYEESALNPGLTTEGSSGPQNHAYRHDHYGSPSSQATVVYSSSPNQGTGYNTSSYSTSKGPVDQGYSEDNGKAYNYGVQPYSTSEQYSSRGYSSPIERKYANDVDSSISSQSMAGFSGYPDQGPNYEAATYQTAARAEDGNDSGERGQVYEYGTSSSSSSRRAMKGVNTSSSTRGSKSNKSGSTANRRASGQEHSFPESPEDITRSLTGLQIIGEEPSAFYSESYGYSSQGLYSTSGRPSAEERSTGSRSRQHSSHQKSQDW